MTTSKDPWGLSVMAHHNNPDDEATLKECINKAEALSQEKIERSFVDKGYRGKEHHPEKLKFIFLGRKTYLRRLKSC